MPLIKAWRLNWAFNQLFSRANYKKQSLALHSPYRFWIALLFKYFPGLCKKPVMLQLRDGGTFMVRNFMTLYIYSEIFIEKCYDHPALGKKDPLIIDIGANTGLFTLRMKQLYPQSTIYCYEPFQSNFEELSENIRLSRLGNIHTFQKGIGKESRTDKLFINKKNNGGHSLFQAEAGSDQYVSIEIIPLKELFDKNRNLYFDLIKIDCEGAEYEIIKSITVEQAARIGSIIFESTDSVYNSDELVDHLKGLGFKIEFKESTCNYIARNAGEGL